MLWEDVLIKCRAADDAIAESVADVFAIDPASVLIVDAVEDALGLVHDSVLVLVERKPLAGASRLHLSLALRHADLECRVQSRTATLAALQRLAARLDCAVITGDESLDPSAWLLIRGSGSVTPVTLDVERLDDDGFVSVLARGSDYRVPTEICVSGSE